MTEKQSEDSVKGCLPLTAEHVVKDYLSSKGFGETLAILTSTSTSSRNADVDISEDDNTRRGELAGMQYASEFRVWKDVKRGHLQERQRTSLAVSNDGEDIARNILKVHGDRRISGDQESNAAIHSRISLEDTPLLDDMVEFALEKNKTSEENTKRSWSSADIGSLKRAVKATKEIADKGQRWKKISELVGNGWRKTDCYNKYKELVQKKKSTKKKKATESEIQSTISEVPQDGSQKRADSSQNSKSKTAKPGEKQSTECTKKDMKCQEMLSTSGGNSSLSYPANYFGRDSGKDGGELRNTEQTNMEALVMEDFDATELTDLGVIEDFGLVSSSVRTIQQNEVRSSVAKGDTLPNSQCRQLRKLLFGDEKKSFNHSWKQQGFFFSCEEKLSYGLVQTKGGPCGALASVQAILLSFLLFESRWTTDSWKEINANVQRQSLLETLAHILWIAGGEKNVCVVMKDVRHAQNTNWWASLSSFEFKSKEETQTFLEHNHEQFTAPDGCGVCLLILSAILSRTIDGVVQDMDGMNSLIGEHGYCNQEMVNLLLVGRAWSNVLDGEDAELGLRGIHKQGRVGFLTLFEHYNYIKVGEFLKSPAFPVWVICSESHYSVLFSLDYRRDAKSFDIYYWDELANQKEEIRLTLTLGAHSGSNTEGLSVQEDDEQGIAHAGTKKAKSSLMELVPPINLVLRTKWKGANIDWNGTEPLL